MARGMILGGNEGSSYKMHQQRVWNATPLKVTNRLKTVEQLLHLGLFNRGETKRGAESERELWARRVPSVLRQQPQEVVLPLLQHLLKILLKQHSGRYSEPEQPSEEGRQAGGRRASAEDNQLLCSQPEPQTVKTKKQQLLWSNRDHFISQWSQTLLYFHIITVYTDGLNLNDLNNKM